MKYEKRKDKYVFEKDGVYFSMTVDQIDEMSKLITKIQKERSTIFKCVVEGDPIDTCTWDDGNPEDCVHSQQGIKKENCKYWKAV